MTTLQTNLACNYSAIPLEEWDAHLLNGQQLFDLAQETLELSNGFAFQFLADTPAILKAAQFISTERLCCPFFKFTLELEPDSGSLWLRITGPEEAKQVLEAGLNWVKFVQVT